MSPKLIDSALAEVFQRVIPEIVLVAAACVIFLGGTVRANRHLWSIAALVALIAAGIALVLNNSPSPSAEGARAATFAAPVVLDSLTCFVRYVALGGGIVLVLLGWKEVGDRQAADFQACLLLIIAGLSLTAAANDLITLFLALELISIPTYVLLYLPRHDEAAQEAAMKYFLLSIFSSALLLFGLSYLYGLAGTTNIPALLHTLNKAPAKELPGLAPVALVLVLAGLGFRITAVPFHFYAPDVYQGAPTVGAAQLAFVPKLAGFVALLRVLGFVLPTDVPGRDGLYIGQALSDQVPILLWFLAAVTMFLGNFLALLQDNLKRLLAYSSIAHAGYMLIALAVAPYVRAQNAIAPDAPDAVDALLYYLVAYGAMTLGAFGVISYLSTRERPVETVDDLAGLGRTHPGAAVLMTIFLFSLIGMPLTAGFTGKFLVFFSAMDAPPLDSFPVFQILALLGVLNAGIAAWYYLRIVSVMYLRIALKPLPGGDNWAAGAALWLCGVATIGLGLPPATDWLLQATRNASGRPASATVQR